jgi:hypothetical protein
MHFRTLLITSTLIFEILICTISFNKFYNPHNLFHKPYISYNPFYKLCILYNLLRNPQSRSYINRFNIKTKRRKYEYLYYLQLNLQARIFKSFNYNSFFVTACGERAKWVVHLTVPHAKPRRSRPSR